MFEFLDRAEFEKEEALWPALETWVERIEYSLGVYGWVEGWKREGTLVWRREPREECSVIPVWRRRDEEEGGEGYDHGKDRLEAKEFIEVM